MGVALVGVAYFNDSRVVVPGGRELFTLCKDRPALLGYLMLIN